MKIFGILNTQSKSTLDIFDDYIYSGEYIGGCIKCRIKNLLNIEDESILRIYSKGNIYLNSSIKILYVNGNCINLNTTETKLIRYLLENENYCTLEDLSLLLANSITQKNIVMILSRLRRKIKYNTGYTVIRNRYKVGYYISN